MPSVIGLASVSLAYVTGAATIWRSARMTPACATTASTCRNVTVPGAAPRKTKNRTVESAITRIGPVASAFTAA